MWARIIEIMLGLWLMASLFIFHSGNIANDLLCGSLVIILGVMSYYARTAWAHFITLAVAAWLIGWGYIQGYPTPAAVQNQIIIGILLAMFAIIPNKTNELPASWQRFYSGARGRQY